MKPETKNGGLNSAPVPIIHIADDFVVLENDAGVPLDKKCYIVQTIAFIAQIMD